MEQVEQATMTPPLFQFYPVPPDSNIPPVPLSPVPPVLLVQYHMFLVYVINKDWFQPAVQKNENESRFEDFGQFFENRSVQIHEFRWRGRVPVPPSPVLPACTWAQPPVPVEQEQPNMNCFMTKMFIGYPWS